MDKDSNENDVLSSNGDGGPDALRMNVKLVDACTEWCGGHWMNRLMIDGFGCSIDPAKSKNIEARTIIEAVKKTVEKINKSDKLTQLFGEQLVNDCINQNIRLQNTPHHRWSNLEELLFKMLCLWQQVIQTFAVSGSVAPIHGMMPVLKEFWTVLSNVKICQKMSQHRNDFSVLQFFFAVIGLCKGTFSSDCTLKIRTSFEERTTTEVLGQQEINHANIHCNNLQPGK